MAWAGPWGYVVSGDIYTSNIRVIPLFFYKIWEICTTNGGGDKTLIQQSNGSDSMLKNVSPFLMCYRRTIAFKQRSMKWIDLFVIIPHPIVNHRKNFIWNYSFKSEIQKRSTLKQGSRAPPPFKRFLRGVPDYMGVHGSTWKYTRVHTGKCGKCTQRYVWQCVGCQRSPLLHVLPCTPPCTRCMMYPRYSHVLPQLPTIDNL